MSTISEKFFEARTVPQGLAIHSRQLQDWYDEHLYYSHYGRTINGHHMTGDHYWYLNFTPIELFLTNSAGLIDQYWDFPLWSQEDDWVMKQIKEAEQSNMATILFTGRGYGKTYMIVAIGLKIYYLVVGSHGIISAAIDDHARPTFDKAKKVMNELEMRHPALRLKRLNDNDDLIQAGEVKFINGEKVDKITSQLEKIVYGNSAGKTKGRRVRFQQFEEVGDWSCSAKLSDCIASSKGTWQVGGASVCRTFYTGTGGTIKSDQAKELFFDPLAFNIYPVSLYEQKKIQVLIPDYRQDNPDLKHGIFLPSIVKRGNFWESEGAVVNKKGELIGHVPSDGVSDLEGAFNDVMREREQMKDQPDLLSKVTQEYPLTMEECFRQGGAGIFDRQGLGVQNLKIATKKVHLPGRPSYYYPEQGTLEWIFTNGRRTGVEWVPGTNADKHKVFITEHPPMDPITGQLIPIRHQYIAGLDSIDQGNLDSLTQKGSKLGLLVKKRQGDMKMASNFYACRYMDRPDDPEEAYDMVLKILWYYSCQVNLEFTKISIRPYFRARGEYWRFVKRPKIAMDTADPNQEASLIGTQMTDKIVQYGIRKIKQHLRENMGMMLDPVLNQQLIDYTIAEKTKFDLVVAMLLCEIADEDMQDVLPTRIKEAEVVEMPVYYKDPDTGHMRYGVPPKPHSRELNMGRKTGAPLSWIDKETGETKYVESHTYGIDANNYANAYS